MPERLSGEHASRSLGGRARALAGRFMRFGVIGVAATITHVGVLTGLVELGGVDPRIANPLGFCVAVFVSYFGNYHWSFRSTRPHRQAMGRFAVVALTSLIGNQALMLLALDVFGWGYEAGILMMVTITPIATFVLSQVLVFGGGTQERSASTTDDRSAGVTEREDIRS